jgi:CheY-like chemotaxis protein
MADRDLKDLKVLLVEDVEDTRLFMRLELERHGFIVFEAADGRSAVHTAASERPDIILMDLTLPVMDGFAAARLIRKNQVAERSANNRSNRAPRNRLSCGRQKIQASMPM